MLRQLAKLLKVLNSDSEPGQIGLAFSLAMVAGFTPLMSLHNLLVLLLVLVLRTNLAAFMLGLVFFTSFAYLLDPLFHILGVQALTAEALNPMWTSLYNNSLARLANFNNTVVMGSLIISLLLFAPLLLTANLLIRKYRQHVLNWVNKSRIMHFFKASKFYGIYQSVLGE